MTDPKWEAEQYRLVQARTLLRALNVRLPTGETVPAYIEKPDGSFVPNPAAKVD